MVCIDLGAPAEALGRRFRRGDHYGDPSQTLMVAIRDLVSHRTGVAVDGPMLLLTHLRTAGYVFNPVSFYYCFEKEHGPLAAIVSEVANTPWGERHMYVQLAEDARFDKEFHVSPFMAMDQQYRWRFTPPGDNLVVQMESFENGERIFDATLVLKQRPLTRWELVKKAFSYPIMTHRVIAAIYVQALRLWAKGVRYHQHPSKRPSQGKEAA